MKKRSPYDRRSGTDRRLKKDLNYFHKGGFERRHNTHERRGPAERRISWIRGIKWRSVWIEKLR